LPAEPLGPARARGAQLFKPAEGPGSEGTSLEGRSMTAPTLAQRERILKRCCKTYFGCPTNLDYPLGARKVGFLRPDYSGYRGWKKFCRGVA